MSLDHIIQEKNGTKAEFEDNRGTKTMLENICTRKVQSLRGGCSRGVHK